MGLIKGNKPSRVVGIDCSSKSLAFAVFEDGRLIKYGEILFGKGDIYERMHRAVTEITALAEFFGKADAIYYESPVYINNRKTVITLSMVLGAAISPLLKAGTMVYPTPPITWQRIMNPALTKEERAAIAKQHTGKSTTWIKAKVREAHKQRGIDAVKSLYGVEVTSDDVSDAVLIGSYGIRQ